MIPGSHLWDSDRVPKVEEAGYGIMDVGDCFVMLGGFYHAGGHNMTKDQYRPVHDLSFIRGYLRQEVSQNSFLGTYAVLTLMFRKTHTCLTLRRRCYHGHLKSKCEWDTQYRVRILDSWISYNLISIWLEIMIPISLEIWMLLKSRLRLLRKYIYAWEARHENALIFDKTLLLV